LDFLLIYFSVVSFKQFFSLKGSQAYYVPEKEKVFIILFFLKRKEIKEKFSLKDFFSLKG
jgi:hypothetical protein